MSRLRALIFAGSDSSVNNNELETNPVNEYGVGAAVYRHAEQCLRAMGVICEPFYAPAGAPPGLTAPTCQQINEAGVYDLVVIPILDSSNDEDVGKFYDPLDAAEVRADGGGVALTIPVFCLQVGLRQCPGALTTAFFDASGTWNAATMNPAIINGNASIDMYGVNQRAIYDGDNLPAGQTCTPIIWGAIADTSGGLTDRRPMTSWSYSTGVAGAANIYFSKVTGIENHLPLLIQVAINDGFLDGSKIRALPFVMNLDHANGAGPDDTGGAQFQPQIINRIGAALRKYNGIIYASIDLSWYDGLQANPDPEIGPRYTTTGALLENLQSNSDVIKYIACHDHKGGPSEATNPNTYSLNKTETNETSPFLEMLSKADIDSRYQDCAAAIVAMGLEVSTDLAHFANDRVNDNWFQLGGRRVELTCSPLNDTVKAGYGFRLARVGGLSRAYPSVNNGTGSDNLPAPHFLVEKCEHYGIRCMAASGTTEKNFNVSGGDEVLNTTKSKHALNHMVLSSPANGTAVYWHTYNFEDLATRIADEAPADGLTSSDRTRTYGDYTIEQWGLMSRFCKDTIDFGADITKYIP